jgi:hypothetical protein
MRTSDSCQKIVLMLSEFQLDGGSHAIRRLNLLLVAL